MVQLVKEYEEKLIETGKKIYPGDMLLRGDNKTNFIYELNGHTLTKDEKDTFDSFRLFRDKFAYLNSLGVKLSFVKTEGDTFNINLILIDTGMPIILGEMLENFFRGKANRVKDLTQLSVASNIFNIRNEKKEVFYTYKVKSFLTNVALGMMPASPWDGNDEATGGYIIVKEDGDVLCYHLYNRNAFKEYLFNNTKFDTPSKTKHHFGKIEDVDGKQILKLNLQIRFLK